MKLLRALLWLIVLFLSFYGADWSIGNRADVTVAHGVERLGFDWGGSQTLDLGVYKIPLPLVEKKYQPPTAFADQINEYQLGLTANNGTEWYGMGCLQTVRFIHVGWWTWAPFFFLGLPLIVLIPSDG